MTQATICIPSNRSLIESVEPIWSAIDYAKSCGMTVVISDNSGDAEKLAYFETAPLHVKFLAEGPESAGQNVMNALSAVETEFVLILGDDDYISLAENAAPFDFANVASDVVGIKPRIELIDSQQNIGEVNDFTLDDTDAAARIIEYTRKMRGGNSSYYSFFRTSEIREIYRLFTESHPTKVGNSHFAVVYALAASGRIVHDPATVIRYDNIRWADIDAASEAMDKLFVTAGLPPETRSYMMLFHFLDSYVLMFRATSNLDMLARYKSAYATVMVFLRRLLFHARQTPSDYFLCSDLIGPLHEAVETPDPDLDRVFHIAGLMADRLRPGLKDKYDRYLLASVQGPAASRSE